jgi:hypothetical protein
MDLGSFNKQLYKRRLFKKIEFQKNYKRGRVPQKLIICL